MAPLQEELTKETGLTEEEVKRRLIKAVPKDSPSVVTAQNYLSAGAMKENSWSHITMLYAPSDPTLKDRMLEALRR